MGYVCRMAPNALPRIAIRWTQGWEAEKKSSQGDLSKNSGERDEGTRTDLGNHNQTGRKPTTVALSCGSLTCHLRHVED